MPAAFLLVVGWVGMRGPSLFVQGPPVPVLVSVTLKQPVRAETLSITLGIPEAAMLIWEDSAVAGRSPALTRSLSLGNRVRHRLSPTEESCPECQKRHQLSAGRGGVALRKRLAFSNHFAFFFFLSCELPHGRVLSLKVM